MGRERSGEITVANGKLLVESQVSSRSLSYVENLRLRSVETSRRETEHKRYFHALIPQVSPRRQSGTEFRSG